MRGTVRTPLVSAGAIRNAGILLGAAITLGAFFAISGREVSAPWRWYAVAAFVVVLLYWVCLLLFLVRHVDNAEALRVGMLHELQDQTDWLRQAQLAARSGVWRIESDEGRVRASEQAAAMFGLSTVDGTIPLERFFERMHPDDRQRVERDFARAREQRLPFASEYRVVLPGEKPRWISARGALAVDSRGEERMTGTVVDITERREALARIERAESQFRELFERNPLPFWVYDILTLRFLAVNEAATAVYGYSREQFLSMTILDIRPQEYRQAVRGSVERMSEHEHEDGIWVHTTRDGRRLDVHVHSSGIEFAGRPARLVLAEDVSERLAYERDLAWRATHDATTGLLNLPALIERLDSALCAEGEGYVVAYAQLRDLELLAPTLGRAASETLLRAAAERFGDIGREFGLAAYLPAETFVVAAIDRRHRDALLARLVADTVAPAVREDGVAHPMDAWIGVAEGPDGCQNAEQVVGHAALAAMRARRDGTPVVHFDADMARDASERLALAGRLRSALEMGEFELHFQPIVRLADDKAVTLEALLRWRRDGILVPPSSFVPLCEQSGLVVPLGDWVLAEAARCHVTLAASGRADMSIAVNVSAVQFLSETLPQAVRAVRASHALPRGALQIELTESALLRRPELARAAMAELREEGVCISIDDFGTGFSSMAYLKQLPLDFLKIDRSFVADVHSEPRSAAICTALIALGHGLGLEVIAEGVECADQLRWLRENGCDQAQGYLFGRPAPLDELLRTL